MKVTLARHGGLAAGMRRPPCIVDGSSLPETQQAELRRLIAEMKDASPIQEADPRRMRDAMTFTISLDDEGQVDVYRQSDLNMSEAFANLMTWLERHAASTQS